MNNKINNITKMGMLLEFTVITALCMAPPVRADASTASEQISASNKPSHGGGGSGGGLPYPTASTVSQLISDIKYANSAGGVITINLAPGTTFDLTSADNTTDGNNGFPVIGGTKAVALTITGNGDIIERIQVISRYGTVKNPFRLFDVVAGASLTLHNVTLKGGSGGAVLNHGTLNVADGSTISGNSNGGINNNGGTVMVSNSTVTNNQNSGSGGGIYNASGTVTINNSVLAGNYAYSGGGIYNNGGTVTVTASAISTDGARFGGAIFNNAGTVILSSSALSGNLAYHADYPWAGGDGGGIYNSGGTLTISNSTLSGNSADPDFGTGGGIYNDTSGTATVENSSNVTGNTASDAGADVHNGGVLQLDGTSTIGILDGNSVIPI